MKLSWSNAPEKSKTFVKYPKLNKIVNTGEFTRLYLLDVPVDVYIHDLRSPKIENGRPVYKTVKDQETKKDKQVLDNVWLASAVCLGDTAVLSDKGKDVKNCPACAFAKENPDMLYGPKRNFVSHVFQYSTNGKAIPAKPPTGSVVTWKFYDKTFDTLDQINQEFEESAGGLGGVDLVLELEGLSMFQKYKISASPTCYALKPDFQSLIEAAWIDENKCQDRIGQAGRRLSREDYQEHLDRILRDNLVVARFENNDASPMDLTNSVPSRTEPSMKDNVGALLGGDSSPKKDKEDDKPAPSMEDLIGNIDF